MEIANNNLKAFVPETGSQEFRSQTKSCELLESQWSSKRETPMKPKTRTENGSKNTSLDKPKSMQILLDKSFYSLGMDPNINLQKIIDKSYYPDDLSLATGNQA
jgi:hypothetical protein